MYKNSCFKVKLHICFVKIIIDIKVYFPDKFPQQFSNKSPRKIAHAHAADVIQNRRTGVGECMRTPPIIPLVCMQPSDTAVSSYQWGMQREPGYYNA